MSEANKAHDYYNTCPDCGDQECVRPATQARDWWLYCFGCNGNYRLTPDGPDQVEKPATLKVVRLG